MWHVALRQGYDIYWTIPTEFKFYFILPAVALLLVVALKKRISVVLLFIVSGIVLAGLIIWPLYEIPRGEVPLWPYFPIFFAGSLTAVLHSELAKSHRIKSTYLKVFFEGISLIVFLLIFILIPHFWSLFAGEHSGFFDPDKGFILIGFLWSLFILFYLNGIGVVRKILEFSFLRFTGIVSFSAYLWHTPVISFIRKYVPSREPSVALLMLAATLVVAAISYIAIEKPFMKMTLHKHTSRD